jgi:hypothetical protein
MATTPSTSADATLPFAGYDGLDVSELKRGLADHSQVELDAAENYERSHKGREAVLDKLRYLRGSEPLPGYDALSVEEILAALEDADLPTTKKVRAYERKFQKRTRVLDEVVRIQRARRAAEPPKAIPAYLPASAPAPASSRANGSPA